MDMDFTRAIVTIEGTAPYSQSKKHDEPFMEGESHDDYDRRTWRAKMTTAIINGKTMMCIPTFALQRSIAEAARYLKKKIPGQGQATWTAKFESGISVLGPISLGIEAKDVESVTVSVDAQGRRGGGSRVPRRFPQIPMGWHATFEVLVLDPIITEAVFREVIEAAGLFKGIGQYRPEKGGSNGRFVLRQLEWIDNRTPVLKAA